MSRDGAEVVALDLTLDDELRRRGLPARRGPPGPGPTQELGLDVADRIVLHVTGLDDLAEGFATLAAEVLAVEVIDAPAGSGTGTALELDDGRERLGVGDEGLARRVEFGEQRPTAIAALVAR